MCTVPPRDPTHGHGGHRPGLKPQHGDTGIRACGTGTTSPAPRGWGCSAAKGHDTEAGREGTRGRGWVSHAGSLGPGEPPRPGRCPPQVRTRRPRVSSPFLALGAFRRSGAAAGPARSPSWTEGPHGPAQPGRPAPAAAPPGDSCQDVPLEHRLPHAAGGVQRPLHGVSPQPALSPGRLAGEPALGVHQWLRCLLRQRGQRDAGGHAGEAPRRCRQRRAAVPDPAANQQRRDLTPVLSLLPAKLLEPCSACKPCFLNAYRRDPLRLVAVLRAILDGEKAAVLKRDRHLPLSFHRRQEELKFSLGLQRLQHRVCEIQALRDGPAASLQPNVRDPQLKTEAKPPESELPSLILEAVKELEAAKQQVLKRIQIWKREQQLAGNGAVFEENLAPLQKRCESLVEVHFQLHQQVMAASAELGPELLPRLLERFNEVLSSLVKSSFVVEKQPPQVLKTQTKFQASVRFLLGPQLLKAAAKPYTVRADMVTEKQARELALSAYSGTLSESTGEIMHNVVALETNPASGTCCANFKNVLLKKIKRCERKGSESVTEEKCAVLFSTTVALTPGNLSVHLQVLSLPIVVIVHGNQDNNAKATVLWDNAFSEIDRVPFVVAERVPWEKMCDTLNLKFMAEVQTTKGLLKDHYFFLAQKIFNDHSARPEDFQSRSVSWAQFNKEILPGRGFTFWQWFDGVLDLTKRCLKSYWSDRLIVGFISKQYVCKLLSTEPDGTFLLRFSDSEIGGVTIAHVIRGKDGSSQVENIQPFSAKDLSIRSLGDRIRDLGQLRNLYPNIPKDQAFGSHYNKEQTGKDGRGYVSTAIKMTVESERDQQPQSTAGGPHDHPQAPMFTPPMLQPELHPESLQSVLSPMCPPAPFCPPSVPAGYQHPPGDTSINIMVSDSLGSFPSPSQMLSPPLVMDPALPRCQDIAFRNPMPFMHNQYLPGGPSPEPRDEEMPELAPFPPMVEAPLPSSPQWMPPSMDLPPSSDFEQFLHDMELEGPALCPPFAPPLQRTGYPSPSTSCWGSGESRWDDSVRPGHA